MPARSSAASPPRRPASSSERSRASWRTRSRRVYAVLGRAEPALWHAQRARALVEAGTDAAEEWDRPAVYEALARASFVAGAKEDGAAWKARAAGLAAAIADADDREVIERDLATLPG